MRYGQLRGSVLGMRVVLPDGQVLDGRSMMRKVCCILFLVLPVTGDYLYIYN